jgi:hypothetical protein
VTPVVIGLLAFLAMAGGTWLGMRLRSALPDHHLGDESKEAVRLGMALIASLTALVLGLVIATAKSAFDEQNSAIRHAAADILTLDRVLADYGPETKGCRDGIRRLVDLQLDRIWDEGSGSVPPDTAAGTRAIETLDAELRRLTPQSDPQRELQARALSISGDIQEARWLRLESGGPPIPTPFLVIIVFWLTVLFWSFGLFSPSNATVKAVFGLCALSAGAAIYLILELEHPFAGIVKVSSEPMHYALSHLGE